MTACNATLNVGGETMTCQNQHGHNRMTKHMAAGSRLLWEDSVPGATPHQDPTPTYEVVPLTNKIEVWRRDPDDRSPLLVASFNRTFHPDPQGAAEAEAARLNGESYDDLVTRLIDRYHTAARERDAALAGADLYHRYREALETIAGPHFLKLHRDDMARIARRVLNGGAA